MNDLFELFWLAGMRKSNKKMARKSFERVIKANDDPEDFVQRLIKDIEYRISVGQFGFNQMLPTTYLNGERWEDDKSIPVSVAPPQLVPPGGYPGSTRTKDVPMEHRLKNRDWAN